MPRTNSKRASAPTAEKGDGASPETPPTNKGKGDSNKKSRPTPTPKKTEDAALNTRVTYLVRHCRCDDGKIVMFTICNEEGNNGFLQMAIERDVAVDTKEERVLSVSSMGGESWKRSLKDLLLKKGIS